MVGYVHRPSNQNGPMKTTESDAFSRRVCFSGRGGAISGAVDWKI